MKLSKQPQQVQAPEPKVEKLEEEKPPLDKPLAYYAQFLKVAPS